MHKTTLVTAMWRKYHVMTDCFLSPLSPARWHSILTTPIESSKKTWTVQDNNLSQLQRWMGMVRSAREWVYRCQVQREVTTFPLFFFFRKKKNSVSEMSFTCHPDKVARKKFIKASLSQSWKIPILYCYDYLIYCALLKSYKKKPWKICV